MKKPNACTSMCVWFWGILLQDVVPAPATPEEESEDREGDHGNVDPNEIGVDQQVEAKDSSGGVLPNHTKCVDLVVIEITSRERELD